MADVHPSLEALAQAVVATLRDPAAVPDEAALGGLAGLPGEALRAAASEGYHRTPAALLEDLRMAATRELLAAGRPTRPAAVAEAVAGRDVTALARRFRARAFMTLEEASRLGGARRFTLGLPSWLGLEPALAYLGRDPRSASEVRAGRRLRLGAQLDGRGYTIAVELAPKRAEVTLDGPGSDHPDAAWNAHRTVVRLLGLHLDPRAFERRLRDDRGLAPLLATAGRPRTVPQTRDVFDALLWVVAGQQVSLPVAFALRRRLTRRAGVQVAEDLWAPPRPAAVAALSVDDLRALGFSRAKADYLLGIAKAVAAGTLEVEDPWMPAPARERRLLAVRGLGVWSVRYLLMRAYGFGDCVPLGDVALARKIQSFRGLEARPATAEIDAWMARFAPFRSLATFALWAWPDPPSARSPGTPAAGADPTA